MSANDVALPNDDFWNPLPDQTRLAPMDNDFWSPFATQAQASIIPADVQVAIWDFSDPVSSIIKADDQRADIALPWFDANRADNPRVLKFSPPSAEMLSVKRGRWISFMLDIAGERERRRFSSFLAEIFDRFPSGAAFQTLADIALSGVAPQAFWDGCMFRLEFIDHPYYAVRRHGRYGTYRPEDAQGLISWPRAVRLAELVGGNPLGQVEEDWLASWIELRADHKAYWSFIDYLGWRFEATASFIPLPSEGPSELDRARFRAAFGTTTPRSRTAGMTTIDRGHIGQLYQLPQSPRIIQRGRF